MNPENNPRIISVPVGNIGAGTAAAYIPAMQAIGKDEIKSVKIADFSTLAGDDTNNVQVELKVKGGRTLATHLNDVASGGLVEGEYKAMTLAAEADLLLADGEQLVADISHNGTGQELAWAVLQIELIA